MYRIIVLTTLILFIFCAIGQNNTDTISMMKLKRSYKYYKEGSEIDFVDLQNIMKTNEDAQQYIKYASHNRFFHYLFIGCAVAGVGYSLVKLQKTGNLYYLWLTGGIIGTYFLISIPIKKAFHKNTRKAINVYNKSLNQSAIRQFDLKLKADVRDIGLVLNF